MRISDYQRWLKAYDEARGFHHASLAHTFIHLTEELGEVARLVLYREGYREPQDEAALRHRLEEELADAATFLFKLAYQLDIDLEAGLLANKDKAERKYNVDDGLTDTRRYLSRQEQNLNRMRGET
jgi:NTP pyrophosphatase (non-canonical NTP hydrolase)